MKLAGAIIGTCLMLISPSRALRRISCRRIAAPALPSCRRRPRLFRKFDDTTNPGMLWVLDGDALWKAKAGDAGKSCAERHGAAGTGMQGVAARYPAFDTELQRPGSIFAQRVKILCRNQASAGAGVCL